MALLITNTDNVTDDATLELVDAWGVTTAVIDGTTYLFASGTNDHGVSVFSVAPDGTLTNTDNTAVFVGGAAGMATAVVGGTTYLFVAAQFADAVHAFSVAADGTSPMPTRSPTMRRWRSKVPKAWRRPSSAAPPICS
jgi:hypothetical protein